MVSKQIKYFENSIVSNWYKREYTCVLIELEVIYMILYIIIEIYYVFLMSIDYLVLLLDHVLKSVVTTIL